MDDQKKKNEGREKKRPSSVDESILKDPFPPL